MSLFLTDSMYNFQAAVVNQHLLSIRRLHLIFQILSFLIIRDIFALSLQAQNISSASSFFVNILFW